MTPPMHRWMEAAIVLLPQTSVGDAKDIVAVSVSPGWVETHSSIHPGTVDIAGELHVGAIPSWTGSENWQVSRRTPDESWMHSFSGAGSPVS